jgi:hypothetical protein
MEGELDMSSTCHVLQQLCLTMHAQLPLQDMSRIRDYLQIHQKSPREINVEALKQAALKFGVLQTNWTVNQMRIIARHVQDPREPDSY